MKELNHTFFSDAIFTKCTLRSFCRELLIVLNVAEI